MRQGAFPGRAVRRLYQANCRPAAGAQAVAWITVKAVGVRVGEGRAEALSKIDTGAFRTFCDACGTSLTYENDERPNEIDLTTASLDDPEHFFRRTEMFSQRRSFPGRR